MKVVLVQNASEPETIEVDGNVDFATFEMIAGSYVNIDPKDIQLLKDGKVVHGKPNSTIKSLGVKDGDVFITRRKPAQSAAPSTSLTSLDFSGISAAQLFGRPASSAHRVTPPSESDRYRRQLLALSKDEINNLRKSNPRLIEQLNNPSEFDKLFNEQRNQMLSERQELERLYTSDIMDPEIQKRIEEIIQKQNIDSQMEHAMEHNPEGFAQTTMLYISCKVNKEPVKAFVDSGAQMTFISESFARKSGMERFIDRRWKGIAKGVGTQNIVGRIHCVQVEINGAFLQISASVLADQDMDMLIGLDMLKRFQCSIDLHKNVLRFNSMNLETPFLPENQLPAHARLNGN